MGGGLFDEFGLGGLLFGEVEAGDLEAVEEEAGAARVDVVGGDALEDLTDGVLDRGAVFGERDFEGGAAAVTGAGVLRGASRGCDGSSRGFQSGGMGCRSGGRR